MSLTDNIDLLKQIKHLHSENVFLKARLEEYQFNADLREKEMLELKLKIASAGEVKSRLDNQVMELELLQNYMGDLEQEAEGAASREMELQQQVGSSVSVRHQLSDLKQQYAYLQTQLSNLQAQLQELNMRNLLLQQQTSRIAELESFLADAEQERDEWKELAELKK